PTLVVIQGYDFFLQQARDLFPVVGQVVLFRIGKLPAQRLVIFRDCIKIMLFFSCFAVFFEQLLAFGGIGIILIGQEIEKVLVILPGKLKLAGRRDLLVLLPVTDRVFKEQAFPEKRLGDVAGQRLFQQDVGQDSAAILHGPTVACFEIIDQRVGDFSHTAVGVAVGIIHGLDTAPARNVIFCNG